MLHRIFFMFLLPLEMSHDKKLHNFCFLSNITKVINTRTYIKARLVAQMGETKTGTFFENLEVMDLFGRSVEGRRSMSVHYKPEGRAIDSRWCHWNLSFTYTFHPHYGSGVDSVY